MKEDHFSHLKSLLLLFLVIRDHNIHLNFRNTLEKEKAKVDGGFQ